MKVSIQGNMISIRFKDDEFDDMEKAEIKAAEIAEKLAAKMGRRIKDRDWVACIGCGVLFTFYLENTGTLRSEVIKE